MKKTLLVLFLSLSFLLNAQTIWSGNFNFTKLTSNQWRVGLVLQADLGLQNVVNVGVCIQDWATSMIPDTLTLLLDSSHIHQQQTFLPPIEVSYYSGVIDLAGISTGSSVSFRFIHCCRAMNLNSFYLDTTWVWSQNPMYVAMAYIVVMPDSVLPIGSSTITQPHQVWVPKDTLSELLVDVNGTPYLDYLVHYSSFTYVGKLVGNSDPCCGWFPVQEPDSCDGDVSVWSYSSMRSQFTYSNNGEWFNPQSGEIEWNPNTIGNIAYTYWISKDYMHTYITHTYRVYDRSLSDVEYIKQTNPIHWEVWDITGRMLYRGSDLSDFTVYLHELNRYNGEIVLIKRVWRNGYVEWTKY